MAHKVSRYAGAGRGKSRGRTNRICADICNGHNADFQRAQQFVPGSSHLSEHEHATKEDIAAYMRTRSERNSNHMRAP